ncbi:MAG: MBOAT family protein, partial [Acutalibacteraceae bacterium]
GMFCLSGNVFTNFEVTSMFKNNVFFLIVAILATFPIAKKIGEFISDKAENDRKFEIIRNIGQAVIPVLMLVLSTLSLVGDSYNPFLYFQF